MDSLASLDTSALLAVLRVAVAERTQRPVPRVEHVWTGPDTKASEARDTAVVVRELLASARRSVLIAGFAFDHGKDILAPLHDAMVRHDVQASLFVDLTPYMREAAPGDPGTAAADLFLSQNWPFGDPKPDLYGDRRGSDVACRSSLHAKCVVADGERTLVTSANFTQRGQVRNVELGVLVDDPGFGRQVSDHWLALVAAGVFIRYGA
jgi:phosphatidylserine/phosphatidylglycerophosphate/cardiolipin synthase-like enzyme